MNIPTFVLSKKAQDWKHYRRILKSCYTGFVFLFELNQPVSALRGAGPAVAAKLARLGISTINDLLSHYPRDYEDRTQFVPLSQFAKYPSVHTIARVVRHDYIGYGRMKTLKIKIQDETSEAELICFNRNFLENLLPVGSRILVHGKFQFRYGELQSSTFEAEPVRDGQQPSQGILPVYSLTEGISQGLMRKLVRQALSMYGLKIENELPADLIQKEALCDKARAIKQVHAPESMDELNRARSSLAFEELFYFQLKIAMRIQSRRQQKLPRKKIQGLLRGRLLERLPFQLTADQKKVLEEITADQEAEHPMARLLQGEVGSGKTIIALLAALNEVERGGQAAIMAPTELLARQHAATAAKLLEPLGIRLAFLTGNINDQSRPNLLAALKEGSIDIVIGTHALFSDDVEYRNLQLVIIDEQHRFGVLQRIALFKKGRIPDTLMMTATPIPRSLALTFFGDLAVSSIRTMPPGRKPVQTHLAKLGHETKVYEFVRNQLKQGHQAYFIYPLIDESDKSDLRNATEMAKKLAEDIYPEFSVALLHSRMKEDEKNRIMDDFVAGRCRVLTATTVVEVGVDVPNATVMVIEHAERFGLSALHQLRGRVGRSDQQSYCFLIYSDSITDDAKKRLKAVYESTDGFKLAEEDLKIRGPGEMLGTAQAGSLRLAIADPVRDLEMLKKARFEAFAVIKQDPALLNPEHAIIRKVLNSQEKIAESL